MANHQIWVSTQGNDSNSGSASAPLKTIQAALNDASSGTDVMVKAGTYTGNLKFFDNDVALISADGNQEATIRPSNQSASTISGFGLEKVTIKGFEIDGANNSNGIHFGMSGSGFSDPIRSLTIQDNKIHSSGGDGVKISQGHNVKVINNDITNSGGEGIDFVAVNGSKIADNFIKGADGTAGIVVKGGSSDVDIVNNKVSDGKVNGISVGGWTDQKWMWPNAHSYEAKNLTVTGNEVWNVNKSAILVSGAHDSYIGKNYLHPDNNYDAVIWIDSSVADHPSPIKSKNITVSGNVFERDDWLQVNSGNKVGLSVSGNKVGAQHAASVKGVWSSAEEASGVAGVSGSAADQKIAVVEGKVEDQPADSAPATDVFTPATAIDADTAPKVIAISKADLPAGFDAEEDDPTGLVVSAGNEFIVYSHVRETEAPAEGTGKADAASADDHLYFRLPGDTADTTASAALTKWQALEDAPAPLETAALADQTHTQDTPAHTDGWLL
jgi:hypothetical protein